MPPLLASKLSSETMKAVLINAYDLKKRGFIHSNVEDSIIEPTIYRVQDTMIEPILGSALYERLIQGIVDDDLTTDERTLIDDYIADCIVAACDWRSVDQTTWEIRNKGTGVTRDEYLSPVNQSDAGRFQNRLIKDFEHYRDRLQRFLCKNTQTYPLYSCDCGCGSSNSIDGLNPSRRGPILNLRFR